MLKLSLRTSAFVATTVTAILATACGGGSKKVAPVQAPASAAVIQQGSSSSTPKASGEAASCTPKACPPATLSFSVSPQDSGGGLSGVVGEKATWEFVAKAEEPGRTALIVFLGSDDSAIKAGSPGETVKIVHNGKKESTTTIRFAIRDQQACENDSSCDVNSKDVTSFDREEEIQVTIAPEGGAVDTSGDPTGGDAAPTSPSGPTVIKISGNCDKKATTDAEIKGGLLQTGISVLTGGPEALIQLGIGAIAGGGLGGSKTQEPPTPC